MHVFGDDASMVNGPLSAATLDTMKMIESKPLIDVISLIRRILRWKNAAEKRAAKREEKE